MTTTTRERCREIAAALDRGDLSVLAVEADFISRHRGEIWELRRHTNTAKTKENREEKQRRSREDLEVEDGADDSYETTGVVVDSCQCGCAECRDGHCAECSDEDCTDRFCRHADDEDDEDDDKEEDEDE